MNSGIFSSKGALGWSLNWTISVIGLDMVKGRGLCYGEGSVCDASWWSGGDRMGGLLVLLGWIGGCKVC